MNANDEVLQLLNNLRSIRIYFGSYYSRILSKEKLTIQNYTMMFILNTAGNINMKTMAEKLGVSNPAVTHFVDNLEKRGFIRRVPSTQDRRVTLLKITEAGRSFIEKVDKRSYAIVSKAFLEFDEKTRENIQMFYQGIIRNFDEELNNEG